MTPPRTVAPNARTLARPVTESRRADRAVDDEGWMRDLLDRVQTGYLATVQDGQPFINSNLFVYDAERHAIYLHTARVGRTRTNAEADPRACFTATEIGRLLPATEALEFSVEYAGVVAFGRLLIVQDADEARDGLQLLLDKYAPHLRPEQHYRPTTNAEVKRTSVYRFEIEQWSGKRKYEDEGFPGAYSADLLHAAIHAEQMRGAFDGAFLQPSAATMQAAYAEYQQSADARKNVQDEDGESA